MWEKEGEQRLENWKQKLISAPALSLPNLDKPFCLFEDAENGVAHGILAKKRGAQEPAAELSEGLDPVLGVPSGIQAKICSVQRGKDQPMKSSSQED